MKLREIEAFFSAFSDGRARALVLEMMILNYTDAILQHHPYGASLNPDELLRQSKQLCRSIFGQIESIQNQPVRLPDLLKRLSRIHEPQDPIWFAEFNEAYMTYKHGGKLKMKMVQLLPYLTGNTYCDIGCGGGDLVAYMKRQVPVFKEYCGIDVLDWRTENLKDEINFQMIDFSKTGSESQEKFDMATCIAVLHHVGQDNRSMKVFLENVRSALTKGGRLLVEEDVILTQDEIQSSESLAVQVELLTATQPLFSEYLYMSPAGQHHVLTIIDLLANSLVVGVLEMAFPFGFRSVTDWSKLFSDCRYTVENVIINGFTAGMFNRSSHVCFILKAN